MFFLFLYFPQKLFCFFCIWLLICLSVRSVNRLVEFSFVIFEYPVLFVLFNPVQVSPFFHQYFFWFISVLSDLFEVIFLDSFLCVVFLNVSASLEVLLVPVVSLFVLLALFPIQVLYFYSNSFVGYLYYH